MHYALNNALRYVDRLGEEALYAPEHREGEQYIHDICRIPPAGIPDVDAVEGLVDIDQEVIADRHEPAEDGQAPVHALHREGERRKRERKTAEKRTYRQAQP